MSTSPSPPSPPSRKESQLGAKCSTDTRDSATASRTSTEEQPMRSMVRMLGMQSRSVCGYCKTIDGSSCYMLESLRLSCESYQGLIDRGWRRSGDLLYLTDHADSCCCYYPVRTRTLDFVSGSSDKRVLRRWRRRFGATCIDNELADTVCISEEQQLKIVIESTGYSDEKYRVFEKYQRTIHNDDTTPERFSSFLCMSPLVHHHCGQDLLSQQEISQDAEHLRTLLPHGLGSYHMCYYIDGALVAVGVIDVLPRCISSVYLFYDPDYSDLSLGSFSALREIALVRQLHRYIPSIEYYYPGYYVPGCSKMTYKSRWRPAEMLDLIS
ncbi:Arginyl-tRNA--protein transferase 1, partial [Coemansia asiatica]